MMWVATNLIKDDLQTTHFISHLESMVCHLRLFVLLTGLCPIIHLGDPPPPPPPQNLTKLPWARKGPQTRN